MNLAISDGPISSTLAPAKLNLFLELLSRRADGYHEIDTVMVPIDVYDRVRLRRCTTPTIKLQADWLPSRRIVADRLGVPIDSELLQIPTDEKNLVTIALLRFIERFDIKGGFQCELLKAIPAGAGLGGASSDAAAALRLAASLCSIPLEHNGLVSIATEVGSDVPFFLGIGNQKLSAAQATGRGEQIRPVSLTKRLEFVIVYPSVSLSTANVYAASQIPETAQSATPLIQRLEGHENGDFRPFMINRLSKPARKLAPQIDEILESMWHRRSGTCQLTGSGSACFAVTNSPTASKRLAVQLQATFCRKDSLSEGAIVIASRSTRVPSRVEIQLT